MQTTRDYLFLTGQYSFYMKAFLSPDRGRLHLTGTIIQAEAAVVVANIYEKLMRCTSRPGVSCSGQLDFIGCKEGKSESGQGDNPPSINKISTCKFFTYKISANIE